jgi:H+/Cl- antiporter ClcA
MLAAFTNMVFTQLISALSRLIAITFSAPVFIAPGLIIGILGGVMGQVYMKAQLSIKRERSNARSPVVAEVNGAFAGLISIRAFGVQQMFRQRSTAKINKCSSLDLVYFNLNRWVGVRAQVRLIAAAS